MRPSIWLATTVLAMGMTVPAGRLLAQGHPGMPVPSKQWTPPEVPSLPPAPFPPPVAAGAPVPSVPMPSAPMPPAPMPPMPSAPVPSAPTPATPAVKTATEDACRQPIADSTKPLAPVPEPATSGVIKVAMPAMPGRDLPEPGLLPAPAVPPTSAAPITPAVPAAAPAPVVAGAQTPTVFLEKIGPASISAGKPFTYEIVVRNTGSVAVHNVRVEDKIPADVRFINATPRPDFRSDQPTWTLGSLAPGAERRIKVEIQPAGEGDLTSSATVTFSSSSYLQTKVTRPRVTLAATGPETAQMGDPVVFHIRMENTGTGPAAGVVLHATLPAGLWHEQGRRIDADIGSLEPGEVKNVTLQTTAVRQGLQVNDVVATSAEGLRASAQVGVNIVEAKLEVTQTGPKRRLLNRESEFTIEVRNKGTATATNVRLTDALPEGLELVTASDGGASEGATRQVSWKIGALAPGQARTVTVKARARSAGDLVSRATAQADRGLEAKAEAPLHVEGVPALLLEVVDLDDPIEVGSETIYEIRVLNQGTAPATRVRITAAAPEGMTVRDATGPVAHQVEGQRVVFTPVGALAPRADALFRIKVAGRQPGDMRFKVEMTADQLTSPVHEEESTRVYSDQ